MRALIADDEPLARRGIRQLLVGHTDITVAGEARDGREAVTELRRLRPELLFLDVQMPELDGFGVLRVVGPEHLPATIFITAYNAFAVRAFEAHALDYLVKPVGEARFADALERVRAHVRTGETAALAHRLRALLDEHERASARARLLVPTPGGELLLDADEIDWIEALDYYAAVHARGERHLLRESLASLERRLDRGRFVRAHRSAIVNLARVRELRAESPREATLVLRDGTHVEVSRRRRRGVVAGLRRLGTGAALTSP